MYKHNSKIIFLFIFIGAVLAASVTKRSENISNSSVSSSIPYSVHYEKFQPTKLQAFDKLNLSAYPETSLFVGYGLPDKKEQNCYFVDNSENINITRDFETPITIGTKTYAISRATMSFSGCQNLVSKYAGYVFNPLSYSEEDYVEKHFPSKSYWVGLHKTNCGSSWKNQYNTEQRYNKIKNDNCDPNKLNVFKNENGRWEIEDKTKTHYCLIQIDSVDYKRPIKVCAPWWQIEQTYSVEPPSRLRANLTPFYNIVLPKTVSVCVDNNITSVIDYQVLKENKDNWNTVDCDSYYNRNGGGDSCMEDMMQEQCFVNECQGDVEKTCELLSTFEAKPKNYQIGTIYDENGQPRKGKIKDKIISHRYLCPPPKPSAAGCEEYVSVELFPTDECKPGGCDTYFECLTGHPTDESFCDSIKGDCERHYGDEPIFVAGSNTIDYFNVKCDDGTTIKNYNVNQVSSTKSKCVKYNVNTLFEESERACEAVKPSVINYVTAGLSEVDIYMDDDNCVRLNNDEDIPEDDYYMEFNASKFFKTRISKVTTVLRESDLNNSMSSSERTITALRDGTYDINDTSSGTPVISNISSLSNIFSKVPSITIGDDNLTLSFAHEIDSNASLGGSSAKDSGSPDDGLEKKYKYFDADWWNRRVVPFDDGEIDAITRPYSAFAKCMEIPLDTSKSSFGTPVFDYKDGTPKTGASILREDYESAKYKEQTTDSDISRYGQYCIREKNLHYVNWYGNANNELYYNTYKCSRLYGRDGKVWATPLKKEIKYYHSVLQKDGVSVKKSATVTDYTKVYTTKSECESKTGMSCKAEGAPYVVKFHAYYLSTTKSATDKYKASSPSIGSSFDWVTGVDGDNLVEDFLQHMGIDYNTVSDSSSFESWLDNAFDNYDKDGILHENSSAQITVNSNQYIPVGYSIVNGKAEKKQTVYYYQYTCDSGYTPEDSGLATYSISDPNKNNVNSSLFVSPNSPTAPKDNCKVANKAKIESDIKANLSSIRSFTGGGYCKKISDIFESSDGKYHYADYNCSKYFGSNGDWDYQYKTYYLYNATHYKRFRTNQCGYGDFNKNGISKSGQNAMLFNTTTSAKDFISNASKNKMTLYEAQDRSYVLNSENIALSETSTTEGHHVIDKKLHAMDIFEIFKKDDDLRLISIDTMSTSDCEKYWKDLNSSLFDVRHEISHNKCIIDFDYFNDTPEPVYEPASIPVNFRNGSFNFKTIGVDTIVVMESYIDGKFGYKTNHFSPVYEDANIKINYKNVFPISRIESDLTTDAFLHFNREINQHTISKKGSLEYITSKMLMETSLAWASTEVDRMSYQQKAGAITYGTMYLSSAATAAGALASSTIVATAALLANPAIYVYNLIFDNKVRKYGEVWRKEQVYYDTSEYRMFPNIYGYDTREVDGEKILYLNTDYYSGRRKKKEAIAVEMDYASSREDYFVNMLGIDKAQYRSVLKREDSEYTISFRSIHWADPSTKKEKRKKSTFDSKIKKKYNVVYYGATNSVGIFVPYKADYEIMAMDKNGNILGKRNVYAENYITSSGTQSYQQVSFSLDPNFNIAKSVKDGDTDHACRRSSVVEWGGGVSGGYYSFGTNEGYTCDKSDDDYVQEHSAVYLSVRRLKSDKINIVKLKHPMPFADRFFVTTLKKLTKRKYECFSDADCKVN